MKTVNKSVLIWFSAQEMFDLVTDVPSYPQFLPWCDQSRIVATHDSGVDAEIGREHGGPSRAAIVERFLLAWGQFSYFLQLLRGRGRLLPHQALDALARAIEQANPPAAHPPAAAPPAPAPPPSRSRPARSPRSTSKLILFTAVNDPNRFSSLSTLTAMSLIINHSTNFHIPILRAGPVTKQPFFFFSSSAR